jgi:hypothetical protein
MEMKKNKYYVDEAQNCCPEPEEECIPETLSVCGDTAKDAYEKYLKDEECKEEEDPEFHICDWDYSEVYFMQYRSKRAFYNEWWKEDLFKDIYNIKAHKHNKGGT